MPPLVSDAGRRVSDQYALHRVADPLNSIGKWFAVRLSDGSSDGVLYDSRRAAVRHQHHDEMYYAFVQIGPWPMSAKDADIFLQVHRRAYMRGLRLADPDHRSGGREIIPRLYRTDQNRQLERLN